MSAPERIWKLLDTRMFYDSKPRFSSTEYIRADIAAQQLAKVKEQRDRLLEEAKAMLGDLRGKYGINEYVCAKAGVHPYSFREQGLSEAISSCADSPDAGTVCDNCEGSGLAMPYGDPSDAIPDNPDGTFDCLRCKGTGRRIE